MSWRTPLVVICCLKKKLRTQQQPEELSAWSPPLLTHILCLMGKRSSVTSGHEQTSQGSRGHGRHPTPRKSWKKLWVRWLESSRATLIFPNKSNLKKVALFHMSESRLNHLKGPHDSGVSRWLCLATEGSTPSI